MKLILTLFAICPFLVQAASIDARKDTVKKLFQSSEEPTTKDAVWTADKTFKVGVLNDGTRRDGYALYVCAVLADYNLTGCLGSGD